MNRSRLASTVNKSNYTAGNVAVIANLLWMLMLTAPLIANAPINTCEFLHNYSDYSMQILQFLKFDIEARSKVIECKQSKLRPFHSK